MYIYIYIYTYAYMYRCVCVCDCDCVHIFRTAGHAVGERPDTSHTPTPCAYVSLLKILILVLIFKQ